MTKSITLYGHARHSLRLQTHGTIRPQNAPFESLNPNGRVRITDPNTGITLGESGAIVEYLIQTYDKDSKLTYTTSPEKFHVSQWIHFQMSEQGPYFGQAAWFAHFHAEKVESAKERYFEQVKRVFYVIDKALGENGGREWLVGDNCTVADLSFVTWDVLVPWIFGESAGDLESEIKEKHPRYFEWNKSLGERETVKKIVEDRVKAMAGH